MDPPYWVSSPQPPIHSSQSTNSYKNIRIINTTFLGAHPWFDFCPSHQELIYICVTAQKSFFVCKSDIAVTQHTLFFFLVYCWSNLYLFLLLSHQWEPIAALWGGTSWLAVQWPGGLWVPTLWLMSMMCCFQFHVNVLFAMLCIWLCKHTVMFYCLNSCPVWLLLHVT